jgi:hypothetical protein
MTEEKQPGSDRKASQTALVGMAWAMGGGLLVVFLFSLGATTGPGKFASTTAVAGLIAGAAAMAGALLGFLFGIPRALQAGERVPPPAPPSKDDAKAEAKAQEEQKAAYGANTNLEQISDWLTKILVGVGLTQIANLGSALKSVTAYIGPGLEVTGHAEVMALAILLYFSIAGFLFGYLWTRLYMAGALREADLATLAQKVSDIESQRVIDLRALSLLEQQLAPARNTDPIPEDELRKALLSASQPIKDTILNRAWQVRAENWESPQTKPVMERTIPIFAALSVDAEASHEVHGQLGFALKDKRNPDWERAEQELTRAIELRGDPTTQGWALYEFNRALCRVHLDQIRNAGQPSAAAVRSAILSDIGVAGHVPELFDWLLQDAAVREWMKVNALTEKELRRASPR